MGVIATAEPAASRPVPRLIAVAGAAFDTVVHQTPLWLLGSAAFMLRGGLLLLLLPLVVVPTPVEIRLLLGGNLGSSGFSAELMIAVVAFAIAATAVLMLMLYALSWLELWSFERVAPGPPAAGVSERKVVARIFSVQAGALSAIALAAIPLTIAAINVTYAELVRPTGSGPLYGRIVAGVQGPLILLVAAVVVVEAVSAVATRRILARDFGLTPAGAGRRWRPAVALSGWLVTLAVLAPSLAVLNAVWQSVKQVLAGFAAPTVESVAPAIVGLAIAWALTVLLTGFASALRGALWTAQELR